MDAKFQIKTEMKSFLSEKLIPFWLKRSIDAENGGYLTAFDEDGNPVPSNEKYLVTQSRMIWGFSHLRAYARPQDQEKMEEAARQGVKFLIAHMWDEEYGGFYWKTDNRGEALDDSKLLYGQVFAIYALSEFGIVYKDKVAIDYAVKSFRLMQIYAADTENGGYFENLERDFRPSAGGDLGGDRKSLDIHMHIMECLTTLHKAFGAPICKKKLLEVMSLITKRMIDKKGGFGLGQFSPDFTCIPSIAIARTWNAERIPDESKQQTKATETISSQKPDGVNAAPAMLTSYGHNLELGWLLDEAAREAGCKDQYDNQIHGLISHALKFGYDKKYGGIYRDGYGESMAFNTDKEWWQNFEALPGFLNGYVKFQDGACAEAFEKTWTFIKSSFLNKEKGESRQLLRRDGQVLIGDMGNPWKGIYHTGRALSECIDRLEKLCE